MPLFAILYAPLQILPNLGEEKRIKKERGSYGRE